MRGPLRDLAVGVLLGVFTFWLSVPAEAGHSYTNYNVYATTHVHDPYWYAYNDTCCYDDDKLWMRTYDSLSNTGADWDQFGWHLVSGATAVYQTRSLGNGAYHWPGLTGPAGHHRLNMVTYDYDCAVDWNHPTSGAFPTSIHPSPGGTCIGQNAGSTAVAKFQVTNHSDQIYGVHQYIVATHIYIKRTLVSPYAWSKGTGCCLGSTQIDLWSTIEHEFGHILGNLGHLIEDNEPVHCPLDPNSSVRATMCSPGHPGYWKERTPSSDDIASMNNAYNS